MRIKNRLKSTAAMAKWKVNQQLRINVAQGELEKIRREVFTAKLNLADETINLFKNTDLADTSQIKQRCVEVIDQEKALDDKQDELDKIKNENLPDAAQEEIYAKASETSNPKEDNFNSGLICQECGAKVPVRFCPNCGTDNSQEAE